EEHRVDPVLLADALRGIRIELIASHGGEHRLAAPELDEAGPGLRRLDLLLELLRRARATGAAGVGREIDHAERTVPLQIDARRHGDRHRAGAAAHQQEREQDWCEEPTHGPPSLIVCTPAYRRALRGSVKFVRLRPSRAA